MPRSVRMEGSLELWMVRGRERLRSGVATLGRGEGLWWFRRDLWLMFWEGVWSYLHNFSLVVFWASVGSVEVSPL